MRQVEKNSHSPGKMQYEQWIIERAFSPPYQGGDTEKGLKS